MSKVFTWDEIKKHNNVGSMWVVIKGNVYDITSFISEHPGGLDVLQEHGGKDATEDFKDVGHSPYAKELRKGFLIGRVEQ